MLVLTKLANQRLLERAHQLTAHGVIVTEGNYSFLKINDEYIHDLYDLFYFARKPDSL